MIEPPLKCIPNGFMTFAELVGDVHKAKDIYNALIADPESVCQGYAVLHIKLTAKLADDSEHSFSGVPSEIGPWIRETLTGKDYKFVQVVGMLVGEKETE